jgi:hypothetical protein
VRAAPLALAAALAASPAPAGADRAAHWYAGIAGLTDFADHVVIGRVVGVAPLRPPEARVTVDVQRELKGSTGRATVDLLHRPWMGAPELGAGQVRLFFLHAPVAGEREYRVVDGDRGVLEPHDLVLAEAARAAASGPTSSWLEQHGGLRARLFPTKAAYRAGEPIDLRLVVLNGSASGLPLRWRDWPLDAHAHARLDVTRSGTPVAARGIDWLSRREVEEYFSKHGRRYELTLAPGAYHVVHLPRINSAEKGWGHKAELGFRWYPMSTPGDYSISATLEHVHPAGPVRAGPVTVTVY